MKKYIVVLIFAFSTFTHGYSQDNVFIFGSSTGIYFSKFTKGSSIDESYPLSNPHGIEVTYEGNFYPSPCFSTIFLVNTSNRLSFQTEFTYTYSRHNIVYKKWNILNPNSRFEYADYDILYSIFQIGLFPSYSLGNSGCFKIIFGTYYNFNMLEEYRGQIKVETYNFVTQVGNTNYIYDYQIADELKGGFGLIAGLNLCIPYGYQNMCIDLRIGRNLSNIMQSPNIKETFASLGIIYFFYY